MAPAMQTSRIAEEVRASNQASPESCITRITCASWSAGAPITCEPKQVKGASMMLVQKVMRQGDMLVEAHVRVAFVSGGRARPIPKPLRTAMQADCVQGSE